MAAQAAELKRELTGRMRARTLEAAKSGAPLQPRWFALADAAALTANVTTGTQQRYRCAQKN